MDLGLGNLAEVKAFCLSPDLAADTKYDVVLAQIARGVAGRFDRLTNRKLARAEGAIHAFDADRSFYVLPRYPVEEIAAFEQRATLLDDWEDAMDLILQRDDASGILDFLSQLGVRAVQFRATWTGGYWFDSSEDASGVLPDGASPVPGELKEAWLMQTLQEFRAKDTELPTGVGSSKKPAVPRPEAMVLLPEVETTLKGFVRYQNI